MASVRKRNWTHKGVEKEAWVVDYTDQDGKRRLKTFTKKKAADKYRLQVETEIEQGTYIDQAEAWTVEQAGDAFLRHTEARHASGAVGQGYVDQVELSLRRSIVPALRGKRIDQLDFSDMGVLVKHMMDDGLQPKTARSRKAIAVAVERFAFKKGKTRRRVLDEASSDYPLKTTGRVRAPTKADMIALLDAAERGFKLQRGRNRRMVRLMVLLASLCGLRYGEICGLTVGACDLDANMIRVRSNVTRYREMKGPKTVAGIRDVPMPEYVKTLIIDWLKRDIVRTKDNRILTTISGLAMMSPQFHKHCWRPLLREAGLWLGEGCDNLHFHALRHFAGSWWLENDMAVPLVSKLMGHASPAVTMAVYVHELATIDERHKAVMDASASLLSMSKGNNDATLRDKPLILQD